MRVILQSWTTLDGAYCNALLLAHWSGCQKLNHVSSCPFLGCGKLSKNVLLVGQFSPNNNAKFGVQNSHFWKNLGTKLKFFEQL